ncbi:MAG TPA: 2-oxoacid ferredoxin oxidoreductase [Candidatus Omnitrophica bacterium]|nr:2-oxoacid ferredoxin oxidoreductase [Candidatus Omnitrophota bacterium]
MTDIGSLGKYETAWCPGCGDFGILDAVKDAFVKLDLDMHKTVLVSGIGQAAKLPQYLDCNFFNGLHGRAIPAATGIKIANRCLNVIVTSGDGDIYGEGGNHFIHAIRRNIDITVIVHNNQVYGLTKGQASPTSDAGFVTKVQTHGVISEPFHPLGVAIVLGAGFVARSFSGDKEHLSQMIQEGVKHKGFSLIDVLQPCVTFNKKNNFVWYKQRIYKLPEDHDAHDKAKAYEKAMEWGDKIPVGIIYHDGRAAYEDACGLMKDKALIDQDVSAPARIRPIFKEFL